MDLHLPYNAIGYHKGDTSEDEEDKIATLGYTILFCTSGLTNEDITKGEHHNKEIEKVIIHMEEIPSDPENNMGEIVKYVVERSLDGENILVNGKLFDGTRILEQMIFDGRPCCGCGG